MPSFEIPDAPLTVEMKPRTEAGAAVLTGQASFTVTNRTARGLRGRAGIEPQGGAQAEWFTIEGEAERDFAAGGTHVFPVRLRAPAAEQAERHGFRFRIVETNLDPDSDFSDSPVVVFDLAARPATAPARRPPVLALALVALAVLVLALGGGTYALLRARPVRVPTLVTNPPQTFEQAQGTLADAGLKAVQAPAAVPSPTVPRDLVVDQDPKGGASLARGSPVTVTLSSGPPPPPPPEGAPLWCRSGNSMIFTENGRSLLVNFGWSAGNQDEIPPGFGKCAWKGREHAESDPTVLVFPVSLPGAKDFVEKARKSPALLFVVRARIDYTTLVVTELNPPL